MHTKKNLVKTIQAQLIAVTLISLIFIALSDPQRVLVDTEKLITAIYDKGTERPIHFFICLSIAGFT